MHSRLARMGPDSHCDEASSRHDIFDYALHQEIDQRTDKPSTTAEKCHDVTNPSMMASCDNEEHESDADKEARFAQKTCMSIADTDLQVLPYEFDRTVE